MSSMVGTTGLTGPTEQAHVQSSITLDNNGLDARTRRGRSKEMHYAPAFPQGMDDDNNVVANEPVFALVDEAGLDQYQWPMVWSNWAHFSIPMSAISPHKNLESAEAQAMAYNWLCANTRFIGLARTDMTFSRRVGLHDLPAKGTAVHHGVAQTVNTSEKEIRAGDYIRVRPPGRPGRYNGESAMQKSINTSKNGILPTKVLGIVEAAKKTTEEEWMAEARVFNGVAPGVVLTAEQLQNAAMYMNNFIGIANSSAAPGQFFDIRLFFKS